MKLATIISRGRRQTGILLTECLVYIAVFAILLGIGTAAFYFCWDHTRAVIYATEDIAAALRAGEQWRADVRAATGTMAVETTPAGEVVRIPEAGKEIIYRFDAGALHREISGTRTAQLLLAKVKTSHMTTDARGAVSACRWELEVIERRPENVLPLLFTFAAVPPKP
jgi:hypothetical protein